MGADWEKKVYHVKVNIPYYECYHYVYIKCANIIFKKTLKITVTGRINVFESILSGCRDHAIPIYDLGIIK